GTAWVNYNPSTGSLLLHVLDIDTAEIVIGAVKQRYESLLLEIFG
ncbi:MAG: Na+/H+ antiporter subunit E, partial [Rhizobiales bacterium]|nr:Na+/H+ antiporter subunit E [Hyphomicrobiales bacterium]